MQIGGSQPQHEENDDVSFLRDLQSLLRYAELLTLRLL